MIPSTKNRSVKLYIFGCQMNKLDGELVQSKLKECGFDFTEDEKSANIILFITCSVRDHAENRVHSRIGALKGWKRKDPDRVLGIMGCMAQKDGDELLQRHSHLDLVIGTRDFHKVGELIEQKRNHNQEVVSIHETLSPQVERRVEVRPRPFQAFLAVMRGCDTYCSYCIVPYVRGPEESRNLSQIEEEADRLLEDGVLEITLLGQTVNHYCDSNGNRLPQVLRALAARPQLRRLNFVTSHPSYMDEELIQAIKESPKITRSLHLPAQSGSDRILKRMKRRYTIAEYRDAVERLKGAVPDMEIASDFIVGFPGEREEDFKATETLMREVGFHQSFIFKYSPRPKTFAAKKYSDDVPQKVKEERNARLLEVQKEISLKKNAAWVGKLAEVLVEGPSRRDPNRFTGRTVYNQIAAFPAGPVDVGKVVRVRVEKATSLTLLCGPILEIVS